MGLNLLKHDLLLKEFILKNYWIHCKKKFVTLSNPDNMILNLKLLLLLLYFQYF